MMSHLDEGTIHAWLDGALDTEHARRVADHVEQCSQCAAAVAEARGLMAASSRILGALDDVPAGVLPPRTAAPERRIRRAVPWAAGIAAALLAAVYLGSGVATRPAADARRDPGRAAEHVAVAVDTASVAGPLAAGPTPQRSPEGRIASAPVVATITAGEGRRAREGRPEAGPPAPAAAPPPVVADAPAPAAAPAPVMADARAPAAAPAPVMADAPAARIRAAPDVQAESPVKLLAEQAPVPAGLAGCYVISRQQGREADFMSRAAAAEARAPQAAVASLDTRAGGRLVIRLDTLSGDSGSIVRRVPGDSLLGWWTPVAGDTAHVELRGLGRHSVAASNRVRCPD